uniref:Putative Calcin n=1 Tax=Megacormus gertschi TaxID=1843536 RepID=A0A224X3X5_9SCOR
MKSFTLVTISILVLITIACLNVNDVEAVESRSRELFRRGTRNCIAHLQRCRKNNDCCSKNCKRRGTQPEQRCR